MAATLAQYNVAGSAYIAIVAHSRQNPWIEDTLSSPEMRENSRTAI